MNEVTKPHFSFSSEAFSVPSPKEVRKCGNKIGESITTLFDSKETQNFTPQRIVTAGLLGVTAASTLLVPQATLPLAKGTLFSWFTPDYDSVTEREKIIEKIATQSFKEIMKDHSIDNIIGYNLLDKVISEKKLSPEQTHYFYASFKKMAEEWSALKVWQDEMDKALDVEWNRRTESREKPSGFMDYFSSLKWRLSKGDEISQEYDSAIDILNNTFKELKDPAVFKVAFENFKQTKKKENFLSRIDIDPKSIIFFTALTVTFFAYHTLKSTYNIA